MADLKSFIKQKYLNFEDPSKIDFEKWYQDLTGEKEPFLVKEIKKNYAPIAENLAKFLRMGNCLF